MKALQFVGEARAQLADLPIPRIAADEVLVATRTVGICHSDIELLEGRYIIPFRYPVIPGHEWAGEVAEALRGTGRLDDAVWGSALGLPEESVRPAGELDGAPLPYLSTLIAPARRDGGRGGKL